MHVMTLPTLRTGELLETERGENTGGILRKGRKV